MTRGQNQIGCNKRNVVMIAFLFAGCFAFLVWKAPYGFVSGDEPYIISCSQRLFLGDKLLVDDWFPAQLVGFINYPFYWIYVMITGGVEGIVMYFRYCYVIIWAAAVIISYYLINEKMHSGIYLCLGSLSLMLFASLDQMTLSYNFWSLLSLLMIIALQINHKAALFDCLTGVFIAIACLACPYLAIPCFIILGIILIACLYQYIAKVKINWLSVVKPRTGMIILGTMAVLVVFLCVLFNGSDFDDIAVGITNVLNTIGYTSRNFSHLIIDKMKVYVPYEYYFGLPLLIISLLDKRNESRNKAYLWTQALISFISAILTTIMLLHGKVVFNTIIIPIAVFGIHLMLFNKEQDPSILFVLFISACYSISIYFSSDLGLLSQSLPLSLIAWITFLEIGKSFKNAKYNRYERIVFCMIMFFQLFTQCGFRTFRTNWDAPIFATTATISIGSAKGIHTTVIEKERYESRLIEVSQVLNGTPKESRVLFLRFFPYLYLDSNHPFGTYTTFTSNSISAEVAQLIRYYKVNPENYPAYVFIDKKEKGIQKASDILLNGHFKRKKP